MGSGVFDTIEHFMEAGATSISEEIPDSNTESFARSQVSDNVIITSRQ